MRNVLQGWQDMFDYIDSFVSNRYSFVNYFSAFDTN